MLTDKQVTGLTAGGCIDIQQDQFREHVRGTARLGDLLWVQERHMCVTTAELISAYRKILMICTVPFPREREIRVELLKCGYRKKFKTKQVPANRMARAFSRITLELATFDPQALSVRCIVHFRHVGELRSPRKVRS